MSATTGRSAARTRRRLCSATRGTGRMPGLFSRIGTTSVSKISATPLVQSAAMAAVLHPPPSYRPLLPDSVIVDGLLSDAQIESVVLAGDAHRQHLQALYRIGSSWETVQRADCDPSNTDDAEDDDEDTDTRCHPGGTDGQRERPGSPPGSLLVSEPGAEAVLGSPPCSSRGSPPYPAPQPNRSSSCTTRRAGTDAVLVRRRCAGFRAVPVSPGGSSGWTKLLDM